MSDITLHRCDGCGKTVEDRYTAIGWIRFEGGGGNLHVSVARSAGRRADRLGVTDYLSDVSDFCTIECLAKALDRVAERLAILR